MVITNYKLNNIFNCIPTMWYSINSTLDYLYTGNFYIFCWSVFVIENGENQVR